eukprot:361204-Chlamydomonas_euryale.AAC.4
MQADAAFASSTRQAKDRAPPWGAILTDRACGQRTSEGDGVATEVGATTEAACGIAGVVGATACCMAGGTVWSCGSHLPRDRASCRQRLQQTRTWMKIRSWRLDGGGMHESARAASVCPREQHGGVCHVDVRSQH